MSSDTIGGLNLTPKEVKRKRFIEAIVEFNSNLGGALGNETRWTRFFKVMRRDDGSWLAMLGTLNEEQQPIIYFGNGVSLMSAWQALGGSLEADAWREDRFA